MCRSLLLLALMLSVPIAARADTSLAVFDLDDRGVGKTVASNLTEIVTRTLGDLGVFRVIARSEVVSMVQLAQEQQLLGCARNDQCAPELGGALGAQYLVTGSVGKVGERLLLTLTLADTGSGNVLAREQREIADARFLLSETESVAKQLVRGLLAGAQGFAAFRVSEEGADVELDGKVIGVTPMGLYALASGPHRVRVLKTGFVAWSRDVMVQKNETTLVDANLIPSAEFIEAYESRARSWRRWAWIATGLGVGALTYGGYTYFVSNASRADEFNRNAVRDNCNADSRLASQQDCGVYRDERSSIQRSDVVSSITIGVGLAALATGIYLFTQGPSPGAYDLYKPSVGPVTLDIGVGERTSFELSMAWP